MKKVFTLGMMSGVFLGFYSSEASAMQNDFEVVEANVIVSIADNFILEKIKSEALKLEDSGLKDEEKSVIKQELTKKLNSLFDNEQESRNAQVAQLEKQVNRLKEHVNARQKEKQKIIESQLTLLEHGHFPFTSHMTHNTPDIAYITVPSAMVEASEGVPEFATKMLDLNHEDFNQAMAKFEDLRKFSNLPPRELFKTEQELVEAKATSEAAKSEILTLKKELEAEKQRSEELKAKVEAASQTGKR